MCRVYERQIIENRVKKYTPYPPPPPPKKPKKKQEKNVSHMGNIKDTRFKSHSGQGSKQNSWYACVRCVRKSVCN